MASQSMQFDVVVRLKSVIHCLFKMFKSEWFEGIRVWVTRPHSPWNFVSTHVVTQQQVTGLSLVGPLVNCVS